MCRILQAAELCSFVGHLPIAVDDAGRLKRSCGENDLQVKLADCKHTKNPQGESIVHQVSPRLRNPLIGAAFCALSEVKKKRCIVRQTQEIVQRRTQSLALNDPELVERQVGS